MYFVVGLVSSVLHMLDGQVKLDLPKLDSLKILFENKPFDVFTVSETWLKPSILDNEIHLPVTLAYDLIDWEKLAVDVWLMFVMGFLIAQDLISVPLLPSLVLSKYLTLNAKSC